MDTFFFYSFETLKLARSQSGSDLIQFIMWSVSKNPENGKSTIQNGIIRYERLLLTASPFVSPYERL